LFQPSDPASLRCFSVLNGAARGAIYTDRLQNPTWGVVQEAAFGSLYLGGDIQYPLLRRLVTRLRRKTNVLIGLWSEDQRWSLLPNAPNYSDYTLEFFDREVHHDLPEIPPGCELRRLDRSLFKHTLNKHLLISMFGSIDLALEHGFGMCLMQEGDLLCEAFAGPSALGLIEMGVESHPRHMRKGYATLTCNHLIHEVEQLGYRTYWNCARSNQASIALARRLGYTTEKEYRLQAWFQQDA
jgi:hypothetical protein